MMIFILVLVLINCQALTEVSVLQQAGNGTIFNVALQKLITF